MQRLTASISLRCSKRLKNMATLESFGVENYSSGITTSLSQSTSPLSQLHQPRERIYAGNRLSLCLALPMTQKKPSCIPDLLFLCQGSIFSGSLNFGYRKHSKTMPSLPLVCLMCIQQFILTSRPLVETLHPTGHGNVLCFRDGGFH